MEKAEVKGVMKNIRYRIIYSQEFCYLIDVDRFLLGYFFPLLFWLFPHPAIKIKKELAEELSVKTSIDSKQSKYSRLGAGLSIFLVALLRPYINNNLNSDWTVIGNGMILFLISCLCIYIRYSLSKNGKKKISNIVDINFNEIVPVKIIPNSYSYIFKLTGLVLFFFSFLILSFIAFISVGNWPLLVCYIVMLMFVLFFNALSLPAKPCKIKKLN